MNKIMMVAAVAALGCASAPAMSATVLGVDVTDNGLLGVDVHYRFGERLGSVGSFGGGYWDIAGQGSFYQVCAELHDHDEIAPSYDVTSGIAAFGAVRNAQLTALFSNAFPLLDSAVTSYVAANGSLAFNAGLADEWAQIGRYSIALQTLTWIIVENDDASIRPTDTATPFGIADDGLGDRAATDYILNWADNINTGAWAPKDGVTLYHAAASDSMIQDRFWMTTANAVPEPATWAMMIGGFAFAGAAMRRRKPVAMAA